MRATALLVLAAANAALAYVPTPRAGGLACGSLRSAVAVQPASSVEMMVRASGLAPAAA